MCNLVGFNGELAPNVDKLKMLMVLGRERGTHSCGLAMNNEVQYGVGHKYKDSLDWIPTLQFPSKFHTKTVIGHNRQATIGAHTAENAHPFVYCNEDGVPEFVFAHNGVIKECNELAAEYGLDYKDYNVDSQLLGDIIYKHGFDVLGKYKGNAALLFYWIKEPNKLYCWKGATKDRVFVNQKWTTDFEDERPLHFVYNNKGIYVASLADHLRCITNHTKEVYTFNHNTIYTITDGHLEVLEKIDRSHIVKPPVAVSTYNYGGWSNNNYGTKHYGTDTSVNRKLIIGPNPHNIAKKKVYFYDGRYYSLGKLLTGKVYINEEDEVVREGRGELFYFKEGIWLKNESKYNANLQCSPAYIFALDLHEDALYWLHHSFDLRCGTNIEKQAKDTEAPYVAGRFCYHGYVVDNGMRVTEYKNIRTDNVENFNTYFGTNCVSEYECEKHYKSMFVTSKGINWEEIEKALEDAELNSENSKNNLLPATTNQYTIDSLLHDIQAEEFENEEIEEASIEMKNYIEETASGANNIVNNYSKLNFTDSKDRDNLKKITSLNDLFTEDLFTLIQ